jgi:hypothetical protein
VPWPSRRGTYVQSHLPLPLCYGAMATELVQPTAFVSHSQVEMPGWLEFDSVDLDPSLPGSPTITLGVGEYDAPWQTGPDPGSHKTGSPKQYNSTYRLETNGLLYEGVRFGFVDVVAPGTGPQKSFTITGIRLVVQTKVLDTPVMLTTRLAH